jgi:hypothetical protein
MFFRSDLETKFHNIKYIIQQLKNVICPIFSQSLPQINNFITQNLFQVFP